MSDLARRRCLRGGRRSRQEPLFAAGDARPGHDGGCDKSISEPRNRFDERWLFGIVAKRPPITEIAWIRLSSVTASIAPGGASMILVLVERLARIRDEIGEAVERTRGKVNRIAAPQELAGAEVDCEDPEGETGSGNR